MITEVVKSRGGQRTGGRKGEGGGGKKAREGGRRRKNTQTDPYMQQNILVKVYY